MTDISIGDIISMQQSLQRKYGGTLKNESISPDNSRIKLLWLVSEVGEVIDLVKKNEPSSVINNSMLRDRILEELSDVLMYYTDILLCFEITPEELKKAFEKKHKQNLFRWEPQNNTD